MRWFNHVTVAGSVAAVIDPGMVPLAMLGSTAPDWLEWIGGTAAGLEHIQPGLRCQRLAGGDHAAGGQYVAAP